MDFQTFSQEWRPVIQQSCEQAIVQSTPSGTLQEAMRYSVQAGGKRFRPLLLLAIYQSFSKEMKKEAQHIAVALELIHTYSLIHDDLPAMDNDDLRRGKPTNHKVFGEAVAILAGDGLLSLAFFLVAKHTSEVKILEKLATYAGTSQHGMVYGQSLDIEGEKKELTLSELKAIHQGKTGGLIQFAAFAAMCLAGFSEEDREMASMLKFAEHLGLAFQIRDDILDETKTTQELGKTAGKDVKQQKSTYPSLLGLNGARRAFDEEIKNATLHLMNCEEKTRNTDVLKSMLQIFNLEE